MATVISLLLSSPDQCESLNCGGRGSISRCLRLVQKRRAFKKLRHQPTIAIFRNRILDA